MLWRGINCRYLTLSYFPSAMRLRMGRKMHYFFFIKLAFIWPTVCQKILFIRSTIRYLIITDRMHTHTQIKKKKQCLCERCRFNCKYITYLIIVMDVWVPTVWLIEQCVMEWLLKILLEKKTYEIFNEIVSQPVGDSVFTSFAVLSFLFFFCYLCLSCGNVIWWCEWLNG